MTLIYFDKDKQAYNFEIEDYIATCPIEKWAYYSQTQNMDKWDIIDGVFTDITNTEEYKEKQRQKERERIGNLSMTRGDVFEALILARGITKTQLRQMIENYELDEVTKALYLNRFDEALEFYRKFPLFDLLGSALGISSEKIDLFFESKDYRYLQAVEK